MISVDLGKQMAGEIFPFVAVFTRLGAALMLFPGVGETHVPSRVRLLLAIFLTMLVLPAVRSTLPAEPATVDGLAALIVHEALIGIYFGSILRLLMGTVETAGSVIAMQTGLSSAMILNPTMAGQSALPSAFLGSAAVALLFITGLEGMLLRGLVDTYALFPPKLSAPVGDMAESYMHLLTRSFAVGVEIAAPFIVIGILLYTALGVMQRLMPQVQLFLIVMPIQIIGGFLLMAATMGAMMAVWLRFMDSSLSGLVKG